MFSVNVDVDVRVDAVIATVVPNDVVDVTVFDVNVKTICDT